MKVTAANGENQQVTLTIEVEAAEVAKAQERACKRLANRVKIPGFRKGKAPQRIVENHLGKEYVLQEAFDSFLGPSPWMRLSRSRILCP